MERTANPISATAQVIDDLTYSYDDGNRLNTVTDASQNYGGYPSSSGTLIDYDDNGNMTSQKDKGINSIGYNYLNLPSSVIYSTTYIIQDPFFGDMEKNINTKYIYDATGEKLKSEYTYYAVRSQSEVKRITDYLDGFQYENNVLQFYPNEEGYYDFVKNRYIYNYKDHLGNIRLSYTKQADGTARILEETNYYPFGLRHTGYNSATIIGSTYRYKYNGKEVQENGMYDYGARMYMPELARWGVTDPMAEQYRGWSPYNYAVNNPVSFIDPDGRMTYDWQLGEYRDNGGQLMNWGDAMNTLYGGLASNTNDHYSSKSSGGDVISFISNILGPGASNIIINFLRGDKGNLGSFVNSDFEANGWHVIDASSLGDALTKLTKYLGDNQADNIYINAHGSTSKRYVLDENGQTIPDLESETGFKMMDDTGFHVGEEKILGTHLQQYISDKSKLSSDKLNSIESFIGIANYVKNGKNLIMGSCYSANDELFGKGLSSLVQSRDIFANRDFSSNYYIRGKGIIPFSNFINYNQTSQNNYEQGWVWYRNGSAIQTNFNIIMTKYGVKTIK